MFKEQDRRRLREELVVAAKSDPRITAAALVGSAARDDEDRWSDIDLAFRVAAELRPEDVVDDWTARMRDRHDAVAHLDIWVGPTLYRVFLLPNTLQVDLSFWPSSEFASNGGAFRLLFGEANRPKSDRPAAVDDMIGMGWLYAQHARSSIARGRLLQALYMINHMRDQVIALACVRFGLPPAQGRGVDDLPDDVKQLLSATLVPALTREDAVRAFRGVADALLIEAANVDRDLAARLDGPVRDLVGTADR